MPPSKNPIRHRLPADAGPRRGARRPHPGRQRRHARRGAGEALGSGHTSPSGPAAGDLAAYTRAQSRPSVVPTEVVDAEVTEYALTAPRPARRAPRPRRSPRRTRPGAEPGSTAVTSTPEAVAGYGAVGVTWGPGQQVPEERARPHRSAPAPDDAWSEWMELEYHEEHGPDPDQRGGPARPAPAATCCWSATSTRSRSGRSTADGTVPADMRMAVIDPGEAAHTAVEKPALDTDTGAPAAPRPRRGHPDAARRHDTDADADDLALRAAVFTPKPVIYSRAQWGANETLRDAGSLHYFEVHAGFVHHTVNANNYSRAEVPGILRSIYAYHTQSRAGATSATTSSSTGSAGSGRGGYGGIDRAVVGAHTLGYNDYAFAMSAIGNFDITEPAVGDGPGVRRPLRLEAVAARHRRVVHAAVGRLQELPGHQRPPRRRADRLPRHATSTPGSPRSGSSPRRPAGLGGSRARVRPRLHRPPGPRGAAGQRRPGLHHPDRRA